MSAKLQKTAEAVAQHETLKQNKYVFAGRSWAGEI